MAGRRHKRTRNTVEHDMQEKLDDLSAFEDFKNDILPKLRKMIKQGITAEDIYKLHQAHAAARSVTIALTSKDEGKALAAAKEILDRGVGRPTEKQEVTHKYANLKDEEIDSQLLTELAKHQAEETKQKH